MSSEFCDSFFRFAIRGFTGSRILLLLEIEGEWSDSTDADLEGLFFGT